MSVSKEEIRTSILTKVYSYDRGRCCQLLLLWSMQDFKLQDREVPDEGKKCKEYKSHLADLTLHSER